MARVASPATRVDALVAKETILMTDVGGLAIETTVLATGARG